MGQTRFQANQHLEFASTSDADRYRAFVTNQLCWNCWCRTSRRFRMEYHCRRCKHPWYYESQIKEWRSLESFARDETIRGSSQSRSRVSAPTVHKHFDRFRLQLVTAFISNLVHKRTNIFETDDTIDLKTELIGEKSCQIPLLVTPEWISPIRPEAAGNPGKLRDQYKKCIVSTADELMSRRKVPAYCHAMVDYACDRIIRRRNVSPEKKCLFLLEGSIRYHTHSDRIIDIIYRHAIRPAWTSKLAKLRSNLNSSEYDPSDTI